MDLGLWYVHHSWLEAGSIVEVLTCSSQVVADACGDRTLEIHNANTFDINAKMADVVEVEEAAETLKLGRVMKGKEFEIMKQHQTDITLG